MNNQTKAFFGGKSGRFMRFAAVSFVVIASAACAHADDPFGLGAADGQNFAVLSTGGYCNLNGASVTGNVGASSAGGGGWGVNGPGTINGQLIASSGAYGNNQGVPITGGVTHNDTQINSAVTAARNGSASNASLTPTASVSGGQVNYQNMTITGHAGQNVVDLNGINMNGNTLYLSAPAGSTFIINDSGSFNLNNSSIVAEGGLTSNDVLYNLTNTGSSVNLTGGQLDGVLLSDGNSISVNGATVNGQVIGQNLNITNSNIVGPSPAGGTSVVPEPSSTLPLVIGVSLLGLMVAARKHRSQPEPIRFGV